MSLMMKITPQVAFSSETLVSATVPVCAVKSVKVGILHRGYSSIPVVMKNNRCTPTVHELFGSAVQDEL